MVFAPWFQAGPADLAAALDETRRGDGAFLPLLTKAATASLLASTDGLSYRPARSLVGAAGQEVRQDFELTMMIPDPHPIRDLAVALTALTQQALALLEPNPLPQGIDFNDLIVQRYAAGSAGITAHRDHVRYVGLVAIFTLTGESDFYLCDDRAGANKRAIPVRPGGVTFMRAPGFDGSKARPFHLLENIRSNRVSLGLRHDTRPGEPT